MMWTDERHDTAPALDLGGRDLPTTAGELFTAAWSHNDMAMQNTFGEGDRQDALGDYFKTIDQKTGGNIASELNYGSGDFAPDSRALLAQANDKLAVMKQKNPALDIEPMTPEQLENNAVTKRRAADKDFAELIARPRGRGATAGLVAGGVAAGLADPINLSMMTVAPEAGLGILAEAGVWGAIGLTGGVVQTALQAPYREEVQPGYLQSGQPFLDILAGGLETAAGAALFRGAANAWERAMTGAWPTSVRDAGNVVGSQANIMGSNVYPTPEGAMAHEQALPKAVDDIIAGRPVDVSKHITPEIEAGVTDAQRDALMAPRQIAEAPSREALPAEPVATGVSPVDPTSADFHSAVRADLDREVSAPSISEAGMPSRAISAGETGLPAPGISSSGLTLPLPSTQPLPTSQISKRTAPLGSLIARATTPPETLVGPTSILGSIDEASKRHILQGSNDLNTLREAAERNKPLVDARLAELVADTPGTTLKIPRIEGEPGSRVKNQKSLQEKIDDGRPPNTISDYLGARIVAETPEALRSLVQKVEDTGGVIDHEDFLDPGKQGYRAVHLQIHLGDGTSMELQVVPRPIANVQEEAHDIRQPVKRMDPTDPLEGPLYRQEMAKARRILDDAWTSAKEWQELRPQLKEIDARQPPATLPEEHSSYFKLDETSSAIPIDRLVSSKTEEENAKGAPNAAKRMAASAGGEIERRRPINVMPLPNGKFLIKDGNASYTAAKAYGWKQMPVHIDDPEPGLMPVARSAMPNGIDMFTPDQLAVDAERFQFKAGGDEAGVTDRLKGVKNWDPILAGQVLVWKDKAGQSWIVDGHQRLALAKRIAAEDPTQHPQLLARTMNEADGVTAEQARASAAMKNIAEGTGTAVDAAKVIRDHPEMADQLPPRSELVRQARGLVNLNPDAFRMVVNDVVPANYAAIVGRLVPGDATMQTALMHLLNKTDPANAVQAEAIARQGIEAGLAKQEAGAQGALFGDQDVAQSLYTERAKVLDRALKTLRRDKTVFSTLVKERQTLAEAGNQLAHEINEQRMTADGQALQILQTLANRTGPISDALRAAAGRAKSDGYPAATRQFVETVRQAASSGDLVRLADSLERGPSHVGVESTAGTIDHGIAAEPVNAADAERAERRIDQTLAERPPLEEPTFEPGAEGLPQGVMPGMEQSAQQLAAARAGPLRPGVPQAAPGGMFAPRPSTTPDMFPAGVDAGGNVTYQSISKALDEVDGYKMAADQIAACAAPAAAAAEAA